MKKLKQSERISILEAKVHNLEAMLLMTLGAISDIGNPETMEKLDDVGTLFMAYGQTMDSFKTTTFQTTAEMPAPEDSNETD